jgi:hypothetical protein
MNSDKQCVNTVMQNLETVLRACSFKRHPLPDGNKRLKGLDLRICQRTSPGWEKVLGRTTVAVKYEYK